MLLPEKKEELDELEKDKDNFLRSIVFIKNYINKVNVLFNNQNKHVKDMIILLNKLEDILNNEVFYEKLK